MFLRFLSRTLVSLDMLGHVFSWYVRTHGKCSTLKNGETLLPRKPQRLDLPEDTEGLGSTQRTASCDMHSGTVDQIFVFVNACRKSVKSCQNEVLKDGNFAKTKNR